MGLPSLGACALVPCPLGVPVPSPPPSSNWGDFLKRLEQMYPVYETDLSVRTEIQELPPLPEFPTAARISHFVAQLEELMGRMNPSSCGPTELHLWLVGKIPMTDVREESLDALLQ